MTQSSDYQFVVYLDTAGEYRWYLWNSENSKKIASSGEGFTRRDDCVRSARLVQSVAGSADIVYARNAI